MTKTYYLPIKSECLAHYFGGACILPSKYIKNRPDDIQNKFDDFLLLTNFKGIQNTDCLLELAITKSEIDELDELKKGFYVYQKPLPISRVKKIIFSSLEQKEQTISNIRVSTAFIPDELIEIGDKFDNEDAEKLKLPDKVEVEDWTENIKRYDRVLGGFALMKLSGEEYMNFSETYFSTLAFFNEAIKYDLISEGKKPNFKFVDAFFGKESFKDLYPFINKVISEDDIYDIAKIEGQEITKNKISRLIDIDKLERGSYIVAVLYTYGVSNGARKKKIDGIILSNFKSEIKKDVSEVVSLCYGINRGYSVFPNKYKTNNIEKHVKFQLNNQLDYYTIESIFQYVYQELISEGFPYLDSWCPKQNKQNFKLSKDDYMILDTHVIAKKKPKVHSPEYLIELLKRYFQKSSEVYFKNFIDSIRMTVYNDTVEELSDELGQKDEQINELSKIVKKKEEEMNRLNRMLDNLNNQETKEEVQKEKKGENKIKNRSQKYDNSDGKLPFHK